MVGVRKFQHAQVSVPNLEETTAFYEEFLGLETRSEGDIVRLTPVDLAATWPRASSNAVLRLAITVGP